MILSLTTLKGSLENPVLVRWDAITYLDGQPESTPRKGTFIHFIGGGYIWVTQSLEDILSLAKEKP